ncbi:hypothetical protein JB92DRAFT_3238552 [Gautieria morchelliformis]|nr:hypothetical protein JB92DRAFT_3238552 [Gautieria morchelliformis]
MEAEKVELGAVSELVRMVLELVRMYKYITLGNIAKATQRKISMCSTIILGYICPVTKLKCLSEVKRKTQTQRLFHYCMRTVFSRLVSA